MLGNLHRNLGQVDHFPSALGPATGQLGSTVGALFQRVLHPLGGRHAGAGKTVGTALAWPFGLGRFPLGFGLQTGHPTRAAGFGRPFQLANPFLQPLDDRLLPDDNGLLPDNAGNQDIPVGSLEVNFRIHTHYMTQPPPAAQGSQNPYRPIHLTNSEQLRDMWIIDFGINMQEADAALYEMPFEYVRSVVKPQRDKHRDAKLKSDWWLHGRPRIEMRQALVGLPRYIGTSQVARHRLFSYIDGSVLPDKTIVVFARDDNHFFGMLHSRIHAVWVLAMGTQLREAKSGLRYLISTCFETFPFPNPTENQREAITIAAAELNRLRENWLNPADVGAADLRRRTLTSLYNQRPTWLANAHDALDAAVADAYGWPADLDDQQLLGQLLALNLKRAAKQANG